MWSAVHEPFTDTLREAIVEDVKNVLASDPRIVTNTIDIIEAENGIQIGIELEFKKYSQVEKILYSFDKQNGLSSA